MNKVPGWELAGLMSLAARASGCSSAEKLREPCIPGVNCDAIYSIKVQASCSVCSECLDSFGQCEPGGSACRRASLDLTLRCYRITDLFLNGELASD